MAEMSREAFWRGHVVHISARVGHRIRLSAASEFGSARPPVTVAAG